jgi:hypothetical protein
MPGHGVPEPNTRDADAVEPVTQQKMQDAYYQKSWALVIGINNYGGQHPTLLNARRDAEELAKLLKERYEFEEVHAV